MLYKYSVLYVKYRSFELTGLFIIYAFQATRQSSGDTVTPVILNVISVVLNMILTWIFIRFLNMDIRGAALATVIANMIILPACFYILTNKKNQLSFGIKYAEPDKFLIKKLFLLGMPAALSQAFKY